MLENIGVVAVNGTGSFATSSEVKLKPLLGDIVGELRAEIDKCAAFDGKGGNM
jgi:hypothetical protein